MIYALFAVGGVVVGVLLGAFTSAAGLVPTVARLERQVDYLHALTRSTPWSARMRGASDVPTNGSTE